MALVRISRDRLLNIEYSDLNDIDKVIVISKQLNIFDELKNMVGGSIEYHISLQQKSPIVLLPVVVINETIVAIKIINESDFDFVKSDNEYCINAYDVLQRISN